MIHLPAADLFGRQIARRSDDEAVVGECGLNVCAQGARETEVQQLQTVLGEKDVRWLQIAVDEAVAVHDAERLDRRET